MDQAFRVLLLCVLFLGFSSSRSIANAKPLISPRTSISLALSLNFADPSLHYADGAWYSFATRDPGSSINIQVARSYDFTNWELLQVDALPILPSWVFTTGDSAVWAPDVVQNLNGEYLLYFAAATAVSPAHHCIGSATSWSIQGPYSASEQPLVCDLTQGGDIDASHFWDTDGARYLIYKVDGNSKPNNKYTPLVLQQVDATDGLTPIGAAVELLNNDGDSDDGIVEAPYIVKAEDGTYFLFFNSGLFTTHNYAINWATAQTIRGPYQRQGVLLRTGDYGLTAPGGLSLARSEDGLQRHAVFHAGEIGHRNLYSIVLQIQGDSVFVV